MTTKINENCITTERPAANRRLGRYQTCIGKKKLQHFSELNTTFNIEILIKKQVYKIQKLINNFTIYTAKQLTSKF